TASVSPSTATGTVQFKIDGNDFGSPVTLTNGTAASGSISSLTAGNHSVAAIYGGDNNYAGSSATQLLQVVNKADQNINFGALAGKTYGDPDFTLIATASSGLAV